MGFVLVLALPWLLVIVLAVILARRRQRIWNAYWLDENEEQRTTEFLHKAWPDLQAGRMVVGNRDESGNLTIQSYGDLKDPDGL